MENKRIAEVLDFLEKHGLGYKLHTHPPLPTIGLALEYWKEIDSTHCKNLFFRNHKGNRHYLVVFECHKEMQIHSLEHILRQGKLSFASAERMERCLGLLPGSVRGRGVGDVARREFHPAPVWACFFMERLSLVRELFPFSCHPEAFLV